MPVPISGIWNATKQTFRSRLTLSPVFRMADLSMSLIGMREMLGFAAAFRPGRSLVFGSLPFA